MNMDFVNDREFKGVWIPREIWLAKDLSMMEKCLLVEIDSLSRQQYGCIATNKRFAEFLGKSVDSIKLYMRSLIDKGYVTSILDKDPVTKQILKRTLIPSYQKIYGIYCEPSVKTSPTPTCENPPSGTGETSPTPSRENYPNNNTYINNTNNNNTTIIGADNSCLAKEEKPKGKRRKAGDLSDEQILEITNQISENEEVRAVLADWINDRRSRRLPLTKQGINLNLNKLKGKSDEVIIASLNQSIERGYRGVFVVEPRGNDCGNYTNSIHESTRTVLSATGATGADYNEAARRKTEQFIREHPELLEPNA